MLKGTWQASKHISNQQSAPCTFPLRAHATCQVDAMLKTSAAVQVCKSASMTQEWEAINCDSSNACTTGSLFAATFIGEKSNPHTELK